MINIYNPIIDKIIEYQTIEDFLKNQKFENDYLGDIVGDILILNDYIRCWSCKNETKIHGLFSRNTICFDDEIYLINKYHLCDIIFIDFDKNKHLHELLNKYFKPYIHKDDTEKFFQNYCKNCGEIQSDYDLLNLSLFDYEDDPIELIKNIELKIHNFNTNVFNGGLNEKIILFTSCYFENEISSKEIFDFTNKIYERKILY